MSELGNSFPDGIILLDKKPGITSMASDNFIKKVASTRKVGHSGTLDPFATGLLPIFVGKALKAMRYTDDYDKAYLCTARFGFATDTMDNLGQKTFENEFTPEDIEGLKADDFKIIRDAFHEVSLYKEQVPPKYSAKKINGKKAYELAREGIEVELKSSPITIYDLRIEEIYVEDSSVFARFYVECSKGTYIRTICDDVGRITGFGAHAVILRRMKCGPFDVSDAVTEERIKELSSNGDFSFVLNETAALSNMDSLQLNEKQYRDVKVGKKIPALNGTEFDKKYAAYYGDKLTAVIYRSTENDRDIMRIDRVFDIDG